MIDYAKRYDKEVDEGNRITGQTIKQACRLDLINRKKSELKTYPYYFDIRIASRYIGLAELITPKPLASFQKWYLSIINGWRLKSDPKIRRYNNSIYSTARKNAKSTIASIILVSELLLNEAKGVNNKEYYIIASKLQQALLTLKQCKSEIKRLQQSSELARNFKINKTTIYSKATGSLIKALPSRSNNLDGLNADIVIADETHAYKNSKLLDVLSSSMGQNPNALLMQTTTASFNYGGSLLTDWKTAQKKLKDQDTNSRSFDALFTQDNQKEVFHNPSSWIKSNPLLEVLEVNRVMKPYLRQQINNSLLKDRSNATLTKNFNLWTQSNNNSFLDDPKQWQVNTIKPINLYNRSNVVIGLDLSRVHDLTSISFTVPIDNGKYYTDTFAFVADRGGIDKKSKADGINYRALEHDNIAYICRKSYGLIDYRKVARYITNLIQKYNWKKVIIGFDPWQASDLIQLLGSDDNIQLVKVSQSVANLTGTIRWLYRLILEHKLLHKKNILYDYAFNNLSTSYDIHGNLYLNKARASEKIDPVFAIIDSLFVQKSLKQQAKNSISNELKNNDFIF